MSDEESLSGVTTSQPENGATQTSKEGNPDLAAIFTDDSGHSTNGGYHKVAELMARFPATAIFKRFGFLNALNILYLQAELATLENELLAAADTSKQSTDPLKQRYLRDFTYLSNGYTTTDDKDDTQWQIVLRIRELLTEYNKAIYYGSQITRLQNPSVAEVKLLRSWMENDGNGGCAVVSGLDYQILQNTPMTDLIALYAREYPDFISTWITEKALNWYHEKIGHKFAKSGPACSAYAKTSIYNRKPVTRFVSFLAVTIASLVPIISIVALNAMHDNTNLRLGFMSLFTVCFCALCSLFTGAKKTEMLAASAAFAAVQVVFISGDNCCPSA